MEPRIRHDSACPVGHIVFSEQSRSTRMKVEQFVVNVNSQEPEKPAAAQATTPVSLSTSASTPATSSAKTTTSTAAP